MEGRTETVPGETRPFVYFVGAGPGDPELLTFRGAKAIAAADVIVYAGSLINPAILDRHARPEAERWDSSRLTLEEVVDIYRAAAEEGAVMARVHSGDPSLYGAIGEQMEILRSEGIPFEVIPGVSSFSAAAAALERELTLPEVSQTVILARAPGRTPVPEEENLSDLASHRATLCLFLSAGRMEAAIPELSRGYGEDCPAAVVVRASWPDERIIRGKLGDILLKVREAGIERTALLVVGRVLDGGGARSRLYHPAFTRGGRAAARKTGGGGS